MLNFRDRLDKMSAPAIFKRVYRWTLETKNSPPQFLKISSADDSSDDFKIGMSLKVEEIEPRMDVFKELNTWKTRLYDGCGGFMEEWEIQPKEIYDIKIDTHESDPYGWVEFKLKWKGMQTFRR